MWLRASFEDTSSSALTSFPSVFLREFPVVFILLVPHNISKLRNLEASVLHFPFVVMILMTWFTAQINHISSAHIFNSGKKKRKAWLTLIQYYNYQHFSSGHCTWVAFYFERRIFYWHCIWLCTPYQGRILRIFNLSRGFHAKPLSLWRKAMWAVPFNLRLLCGGTMLPKLSIIYSINYSASLVKVLPFEICSFIFFTPGFRVTSQKAESLHTILLQRSQSLSWKCTLRARTG